MVKVRQYTFDTEFYYWAEDPDGACRIHFQPISIGMVCEDGRKYYAVLDADHSVYPDPWIQDNVVAKLPPKDTWKDAAQIREEIIQFLSEGGPVGEISLWSDHPGPDQAILHAIVAPERGWFFNYLRERGIGRVQFRLLGDYYETLGKPKPKEDFFFHPPEDLEHIALHDAEAHMQTLKAMDALSSSITFHAVKNIRDLRAHFRVAVSQLQRVTNSLNGFFSPSDPLP